MLAVDLAWALDPVRFAQAAGLEPDPWQEQVLRSAAGRKLLNCSRQSGKSTMAAVLAVHTAIYQPGALVLLLSPTIRQSSELFKRSQSIFRAAGRPAAVASETALTLTLANGSRLVALPGKEATIRGFSGVRLLVVDEAARVPDDLVFSVRPMLAISGGDLVAMSTPWGTRGWFYEAWSGSEGWERYEVPAAQCPRISPAFLAEERRNIGSHWYAQEYNCEFLDAESAAFRREDIDRAFSEAVELWDLRFV